MKDAKSIVYLSLAIGMLIYAVPRLEIGQGFTLPTVFGIVWVCMALLIVAAHLHHILRVDEESSSRLATVKRATRWQMEQRLKGSIRHFQGRKTS